MCIRIYELECQVPSRDLPGRDSPPQPTPLVSPRKCDSYQLHSICANPELIHGILILTET
jgi:hypothetical protein